MRFQLDQCWQRIFDRVDQIICVSDWTKSHLSEEFPQTANKITVIRNGFEPICRRKSLNEGSFQLTTISRWEDYKNLDLIPKILQKLGEGFVWNLITNQEGEERLKVFQGKQLRIFKHLSQEQLNQVLKITDLLVHPSRYEGFCLPAAESISMGIPVVHVKGSGIDEVVEPGLGQGLKPSSPPDVWASAIGELCLQSRNEEFRNRFAKIAESKPDWSQCAAKTAKLYEDLTL